MVRRLPPLKQLYAFEAAARFQSFKDAAEELHVTQAAVSHQVRALEDRLGQKLFHRKTRQLVLTDAAQILAQSLLGAFNEINAAVERIESKRMSGPLRLSVAPFFANRVLLSLLPRFHGKYPEIRVEPKMNAGVVDLKSDDIDGAIRFGDGKWRGVTSLLLKQDQLGPVAAPALVNEHQLPMSPEAIARLPLACYSGGLDDWPHWFSQFGARAQDLPQMIEYADRPTAIDCALSGNGVALADVDMMESEVRVGNLVRLHPASTPAKKSMYMVYVETAYPDPRLLAFADWLQEELRTTVQT